MTHEELKHPFMITARVTQNKVLSKTQYLRQHWNWEKWLQSFWM